ncbi:hypothetical protein FE257_004862 [Aspergillus nanangensis]|uniref:Uncharacterized protein n=1 Tax=Aspergillus nanangensis TaxID=2582783 RepID=A0AAD4CAP0_ASPNN|nr:hypothetical protein FE257_004862 [Aspergillus nanangensis]
MLPLLWAPCASTGGPSMADPEQSIQIVAYQQLFPTRAGSHYIHIRYPQGRQSPAPAPDQAQQAVDAVLQAWEAAEAARQATPIEPDALADANPWLRSTRWPEALQGIPGADLLRSVATPDPEPQDTVEQGVRVLWETMEQVVRRSQQTVRYCGAAIRMEAHSQEWAYPIYDLTARQRAKWENLWWLVQQPEAPIEVEEALQPWIMRPREQACLEFCVELLNQRHRTHEYKSALICAMAVLGRSERGWQGPDSYPPISSRVIKIARFMVVQKTLWLDSMVIPIIRMWQKKQTETPWALLSADQELEDIDEGYSSSRASSPISEAAGAAESKLGWSFLQNSRTLWPVDEQHWLIQRLRTEPPMQQQLIRGQQLHPRRSHGYFQQATKFKELLAVLCHITAGQPARGPELLSIQHQNTETNVHRNKMVCLVTAYHKGFYASNDIKLIHRYVPQEVGELIIYYLWLVQPFIDQLTAWQQAHAPAPPAPVATPMAPTAHTRALLWGPDPGTQREWSSDRLREVLKRETGERLGQAINVHAYRDITIGISQRFLRPSSQFPHNKQETQDQATAILNTDDEESMDPEQ